jgi:hypothetical protein
VVGERKKGKKKKKNRPSQARLWSGTKPNCYGREEEKIGRNRGIPEPSWAFVETNTKHQLGFVRDQIISKYRGYHCFHQGGLT